MGIFLMGLLYFPSVLSIFLVKASGISGVTLEDVANYFEPAALSMKFLRCVFYRILDCQQTPISND